MIKLAIVTTHPIQYNAPLFRFLVSSESFELKVFYTWGKNSLNIFDPGFDKLRSWDIDLLEGYDHVFVRNVAANRGSHHFRGIINPDLIQQVDSFKPDAIIVYGWKFHSHIKLMRYFKGKIPIIFRGDSNLLDEKSVFSTKKTFRWLLLNWVYKHIDFAFSPGSASDAYFKWVGLKSRQIIRVPHAIDNHRFNGELESGVSALDQRSLEWRRNLGISDEKKVFLYAGKFEAKKDPFILIEAFKKLYKKRSDIHLIMVGDGILKSDLENILLDYPEQQATQKVSGISILPFQNQSMMPIVYRLADIFVLPSKGPGETWGLSVNEAMACGKAVIVSDKCGCASDLLYGENERFIFTGGDVKSLENAMELMLENNAYLRIGSMNRERIRSFTYASFYEALRRNLNES